MSVEGDVLVEGSWFKRSELPTILGNFMRSSAEHASDAKEAWMEVERLRRRVAELEAAFDLEKHVVEELEDEEAALERALKERLQRDAHVASVEAALFEVRRRLDGIRDLCLEARGRNAYVVSRAKLERVISGASVVDRS